MGESENRPEKQRALMVVRLSRETEATTSPERQLKDCEELCAERGYEVVGVAEDLNVSAAVKPQERPKLGAWLKTPERYDVIVFYRMDRLVRRLADLADLISWGQENHVKLVSANEKFLDLDTPFGDIIALLVAKVAEMELEAIRARTGSASRHTLVSGRWRGGVPPWGYLPEKDGKHWKLVQDPQQVAVIREIVDRVLAHEPLRAIAHDLTKRGVPTARDRVSEASGREMEGFEWHSSPLKRALTSPTLLGQIVMREAVLDADGQALRDAKGNRVLGKEEVVVDEAGVPVVRAEPILSRDVFDRVGKELAGRENRKEPTKRSSGLLLRVIYCGACGRPAYRLKGGPGRKPRYRCGSAQDTRQCDNRTIPLEDADREVTEKVLDTLGSMERMKRVWFTGNDVLAELDEVREMLADLAEQIGTPAFRRGTPGRERMDARIKALSIRQQELEAMPVEQAGWRYEGTGQTLGEWWAEQDDSARNLWLRQSGIRASWTSHTVNGRTVRDSWVIDMGKPDLDAEELPGMVARMAELKGIDAWGHVENLRGLPETLAAAYWQQGDSLD
ncbi:recombinase family protein [Gordonia malaquae]|uniref:recombinase family protein n=1 Tax=Gordonia malaquae TaxID=410332 RepID=UPI000A56F38A|nr:recombinase family protein [Gordonia malaquae]